MDRKVAMAAHGARQNMKRTAVAGQDRGDLSATATAAVTMATRSEGPFTWGQLDQLAEALGLGEQVLLDHIRATIAAVPTEHPELRE